MASEPASSSFFFFGENGFGNRASLAVFGVAGKVPGVLSGAGTGMVNLSKACLKRPPIRGLLRTVTTWSKAASVNSLRCCFCFF